MIEVKDVDFSYKRKSQRQILDMSFTLKDNFFTCLMGHNGAGKTTLMKLIYGSLIPDLGEVLYDGRKIDMNSIFAYRQDVAFVTRDSDWHFGCSLLEYIRQKKVFYPKFDPDEFISILKLFSFPEDKLGLLYSELSTGEQMEVMVAFDLARHPKYIMLDEPFANLDPVAKIVLTECLHKRVMEEKLGVFLSTHLLEEITDIVDYVVIVENGRLVKCGDRDEVLQSFDAGNLCETLHNAAAQQRV